MKVLSDYLSGKIIQWLEEKNAIFNKITLYSYDNCFIRVEGLIPRRSAAYKVLNPNTNTL